MQQAGDGDAATSLTIEGRSDFHSADVVVKHSAELKCLRGSFHQGNQRFKYGGVQCMAISLASLATHALRSVFCGKQVI